MKTITISTENSETYSSISNFFIDYYMTEANGEFVKVYLYLVRLLSDNKAITVAGIADHFNLTENDICRAIKYWISRDVLKLNYDGRGRLSGIVLLPLHSPVLDSKVDTDAVSILRAGSEDEHDEEEKNPGNVRSFAIPESAREIEPEIKHETTELTAPAKPSFTPKQIDAKDEDPNWVEIMYLVETLFEKTLSATDINTLLYVYETLGFSVELFEYLLEYCVEMGKKNCRYLEVVAIAWYKDGIKTRQQAKEQASVTSAITKIIFKALGIRRSRPTNIELAYINTWIKDFGFSAELISYACDKAVLAAPSSVNISYINGILENWNKNNVKSIEDVDRLDKEHAAKRAASRNTSPMSTKVSNFSNFMHTKNDDELAEMEKLFLKEVNSK